MNNKGQFNLGGVILMFIVVIVCVALLGQIIDTQAQVTDLQSVTDESTDLGSCYVYNLSGTGLYEVNESNSACNVTVNNWYSDWRASESQCYPSSVAVTNSTGTLTLTEGTDYNLYASSGLIQYLNTSNTNNNSLADNVTLTDYDFCAEGYNKDSGARGIAGLWSLFAVFIILAGVIFYGIKYWGWLE